MPELWTLGVIRAMKYIATRDVWSGTQCPLSDFGKNVTIKRGTVVDFGGDVPWRNLPKDEYLKYSNFFDSPPSLVLLDSPEGQQVLADVQRVEKLEAEKMKKVQDDIAAAKPKWHQSPSGQIVIAVAAIVLGALILGVLAHYIPQWIH